MKLHLPLLLLTSLVSSLAAHSTHAAEIPADYESIDLWIPDMLEDYRASDSTGKYAFILWTDMEFTPQTSTSWGASTPLITGGNHIFTTSEGYVPMALSFTSGDSKVFQQVSCLTFDTLSKLNISAQSETSHGGSINLGTSGNLTIQHIDDGHQDTADSFSTTTRFQLQQTNTAVPSTPTGPAQKSTSPTMAAYNSLKTP
ncbi:MAG: hypothetical protein UHH87_00015 [Akkermansia sp.]|nr:hypothetical protein [Akkermansia sp.]